MSLSSASVENFSDACVTRSDAFPPLMKNRHFKDLQFFLPTPIVICDKCHYI